MTGVGTQSSDPYSWTKRWQSLLRSGCAYHRVRGSREGKAICVTFQCTETLPANQCSPVNILDLGQVYYHIIHWDRMRKKGNQRCEQRGEALPSHSERLSFSLHCVILRHCIPLPVHIILFNPSSLLNRDHSLEPYPWPWIVFHMALTTLWPSTFTCHHTFRVSLNVGLDDVFDYL